MKNKHILFVITRSGQIGGAQIHILNLSNWLLKRGYKVSVIHGEKGLLFELLNEKGVFCYPINILKREIKPIYDLFSLIKIAKILRKIDPDLISVHSFKVGILIRLLKAFGLSTPVIFTAHGFTFYRTLKYDMVKKLFFLVERYLNKNIEKLICVCNKDEEYAILNSITQKSKLTVMHNGVFKSIYSKVLESKINKLKLITIARFEYPKDYETLFYSLSLIKDLNWELTIIGNGPGLESMKLKAKNLSIYERLIFKGLVKDVDKYLSISDVFILSSYSEGFPRSILQAMSNKLPIIASNVGGVVESVCHEENGYLFQPGDQKKLAEYIKIIYFDNNKRKNFALESLQRFEKYFDFEIMANKVESLYLQLLDKK